MGAITDHDTIDPQKLEAEIIELDRYAQWARTVIDLPQLKVLVIGNGPNAGCCSARNRRDGTGERPVAAMSVSPHAKRDAVRAKSRNAKASRSGLTERVGSKNCAP